MKEIIEVIYYALSCLDLGIKISKNLIENSEKEKLRVNLYNKIEITFL